MHSDTGLFAQYAASSWPQRGVLILLALFPFVSVSVHSGGSTLYALLLLPALAYAWPERKSLEVEQKRWLQAYVLLFAIAALSLLFASDLTLGVEKLERYLRLATLGLLYLFLRRMQVETGRFLLLGVVAAAFSLGAQAWYQVEVLEHPVATGLYHKIVFGDMAMLGVAIMLAALFTLTSRAWHVLLLALAISAALYASLMSATRGSWLLLPLLVLLLAWLFRHKLGGRGKTGLAVTVILLGAALATWQPTAVVQPVLKGIHEVERYLGDPNKAGSWGARLEMWGNSIKIWRQNPWLGTGLGDFRHDSRQLVARGLSENRLVAERFGHAHSIYFDALASLGGIGLLVLVIALFILPWRHFSQYWQAAESPTERFYALAGLLTVAAFAVFGLTEGWTSRNPFVNPYIIYIAVFASSLAVFAARRMDRRLQE